MPLTQSPLDRQLMKKEELKVGLPWRLLTTAVLTFGITVALYLGMNLGLKTFLNYKIDSLNQQLDQLANSVSDDQAKNFLTFYSQLSNMNSVLKNRQSSSKFFDFLEKNSLKTTNYTTLNVNYATGNVKLDGKTPDFENLAEQMAVFQNAPEVQRVVLSNANLAQDKTGGVKFTLQLFLKQ